MGFRAVTCGNGEDGVCVDGVEVDASDDAALDVRLRWLGCGQWRREPLKR